jgi:uncharacterized membrane protein YphA (DoxX/SURF4 family)
MTEQKNNKDIFGKVLGILFFICGLPKLLSVQGAVDNFNKWHLGDNLRYVVGVIELVLGILMFVPSLKRYAAFGYYNIMAAGFIVHIVAGEYTLTAMPLILGSVVFFYLYKEKIVQL